MIIIPKKTGVSAAEWVQLTSFDALDDPASITDGATGVSGGLITFQSKDTVTGQIDGYQENVAVFQTSLLGALPDFDPATDVLDLRLDIASLPLNTSKYGLMFFASDGPVSGRASWNCGGVHIYPNATTQINAGIIGATAQGTGTNLASNTNPCTSLFGRLWWHQEAAPTVRVSGQLRRSGADEQPLSGLGGAGAAFAGALSAWRLCVALERVSTVDITDNIVQARAYVRRVRVGDPFS